MYEIKEIKIWPFARSVAIIVGAINLLFGIAWLFIFFFLLSPFRFRYGYYGIETLMPLMGYAGFFLASLLFSYLAGALAAAIYNWVSQKIGGIKIDIKYLGDK